MLFMHTYIWKKIRALFSLRGFIRARAAHLRLGTKGERIASRILCEKGLEYLYRNYKCKHGEIDLIFRDGTTLCFVEVKTRHRQLYYEPADSVGAAKRKNIIRSAASYIKAIGSPELKYRFDIVEVIFDGRRLSVVRHWRAAFTDVDKKKRRYG